MNREVRIRCPKCDWEPDESSRWYCRACGTRWNTFATGGRCPTCGKIYKDTQCQIYRGGCIEWSPHLDWYEGLDEIVVKLKEEIEHEWSVTIDK